MKLKEPLPYDVTNPKDIERYAKGLVGKTFRQVLSEVDTTTKKVKRKSNKGFLGQFLEENYFFYAPNSDMRPDFEEADVELKVTPLKRLKDGRFVAKERIVLGMINYMDIVKEDWDTSTFKMKNSLLLLIFYLFEKDKQRLDLLVVLVRLWNFSVKDLQIIKNDWERIIGKIREGKAHEISEGDTFYLGACTKGVDSKKSMREQPFSDIRAKQRAFSLKLKYVNHILAESDDTEPVIKRHEELQSKAPETIILERLEPYRGMDIEEIHAKIADDLNKGTKQYYASLAARMLGLKKNKIEEFEKADIEVKTIRLRKNGTPKEDMSFPYFEYNKIIDERWEDSRILEKLDKRFFFMIFKYDEHRRLRFLKGMFWKIPYEDLMEVKRVWNETKRRINQEREEELPKKSENRVSHVRPHGRDSSDTIETPSGKMLPKKCFWLNAKYLKEQIFEDM